MSGKLLHQFMIGEYSAACTPTQARTIYRRTLGPTLYLVLHSAGSPARVLTSATVGVLGRLNAKAKACAESMMSRTKVAVVPYMHRLTRSLKKVAQRSDARLVISAQNRLFTLRRMRDPLVIREQSCGTKQYGARFTTFND